MVFFLKGFAQAGPGFYNPSNKRRPKTFI